MLRLVTGCSRISPSIVVARSILNTGLRWSSSGATLVYPPSPSAQHSDLATFLSYSKRTGLDEKSTVYVGTHYEYTVADTLTKYGFSLQRVGGASDYGIDLLGTWAVPPPDQAGGANGHGEDTIRMIIQCKAGGSQRSGPQHIRELEGAFAGAPPGWRTSAPGAGRVMALLVAERAATKGVQDALGRSKWPMGYVFCEGNGSVRQILWNARATELGLEGVEIGTRHVGGEKELVIMRQGRRVAFKS
ncbi:hypothetical protein VHEMI04272 [[Torrubiella] hemipterigena]|uniref:Uncharacterized protein n=1 Tax=[Torrubiella] hemipterigena TaxID=1531966 RepID=A0A0A1T0S1_9HYPO|nr:hypothetical protein VHEMI04272 [[Torrubiella] hemipterigena]